MKKVLSFLTATLIFISCSEKDDKAPEDVLQYAEEAIEASINTYPVKDFLESYFHQSVPQEYINKLNSNMIVWRGLEHTVTLRGTETIENHVDGNQEYLLKYWTKFKDNREYSYLLQVSKKGDKMALKRFEPLNAAIASSFYAPSSNFDIPDYNSNMTQFYSTYIGIIASLIVILVFAFWKKEYLLLLGIPFLFMYKQGMSTFHYKGIDIISPKTHFGLPSLEGIDPYFTHLSIIPTGVFYTLAAIGVFLAGKFLIKVIKSHNRQFSLEQHSLNP